MQKIIYRKWRNLILYLRKNYASFAKLYLDFKLWKNYKQDSILVYTMGKVGSTSILKSLEAQLEPYSIYHIHWINKKNLIADKKFHKKYYDQNTFDHMKLSDRVKLDILPEYIIRGFFVNKLLNSNWRKPNECKVITLTRDPIAREVSWFFQNLKKYFGYTNLKDLNNFDREILAEELTDVFLKEYKSKYGINFFNLDSLTWFDEELKKVFGIDVFSTSFPQEKGFALYENEGVRVLLIRLEDLNRVFRVASAQLLGKSLKIVESKNVGADKSYSAIYKAFKSKLILPDWYVDKMYTSKYANHFYSKSEIEQFRNKWTKNNMLAK